MLEYIKEHIIEELDGAVEYWTKALECKDEAMGTMFRHMADAELEHANTLTKMLKKIEPDESNMKESDTIYKNILEAYSSAMNKIEMIKKLYWAK